MKNGRFTSLLLAFGVLVTVSPVPAAAHQPHPRAEAMTVSIPHPVGSHWLVAVVSANLDANAEVASNAENAAADDGFRYVRVRVWAKKTTAGTQRLMDVIGLQLRGRATSRFYRPASVTTSGDLRAQPPAGRGDTITGDVFFLVAETDLMAKGLRLRASHRGWPDLEAWYRVAPNARPTVIKAFQPWDGNQLKSSFVVADRKRGSCWSGSYRVGLPDAWRCNSQSRIYDPCFANLWETHVACSTGLPGRRLVLIRLTERLPKRYANGPNDYRPGSWALLLANGDRCGLMGGATVVVKGRRMNYGCKSGAVIWGGIDKSRAHWRVDVQYDEYEHGKPVRTTPVGVVRAW